MIGPPRAERGITDPAIGTGPRQGRRPSGRIRSLLRWGLQLLATGLVTWIIVDQVGLSLRGAWSLSAIPDFRFLPLTASVLVLVASFGMSAWLWGRMVRELGGVEPGVVTSIRIVLTANLGRYVPGKIWQIAGLAVLARRAGIPATVGTAAGVLGQTFSLAAAGVLALPTLLGVGGRTGIAGMVAVGVLVSVAVLASVPTVFRVCLGALYRFARLPSDERPRTGIGFGARWLLWYGANWIGYSIAFLLLVGGLGSTGAPLEFASSFAAAYLLGYVAFFAPAGLGVRDSLLAVFLEPTLGTGAIMVAVVARIWMTLVELAPAAAFAFWEVGRDDRSGEGGPVHGGGAS